MKLQLLDPANLKLSQKGLILVSVPLIFGIIFVATLYFLLTQAELEAKREAHSKQVIASQQTIITLFYDAGTTLFAYALGNRDKMAAKRLDQLLEEIRTTLDNLASLVAGDPEQAANLRSLQAHTNKALELTVTSRARIDEIGRMALFDSSKEQEEMRNVYWQIVDDSIKLQNKQKEEDRSFQAKHMRLNLPVNQFLLAGVAANILLALSLSKFFTEGTTRRLSVLMENTDRLARKQELNPELDGQDEIAQLDHTFHKMAEALRQTEKLRQAVVATVTHELRTPLSSIQGYLELLESGTFGVTLDGQAKKGLEIAERNSGRLINLINDLLSIDKLESGTFHLNFEKIEVSEVVARSVDATKVYADKQGIELEVIPTSEQIFADEERLVQVLVNFISNAVKFAPEGSTVTIETVKLPSAVEVRVVDRGRGIPSQYKNVVFERFQQVDKTDSKVKGGTGLGLAICKAIIEQHKGEIGCESEEGKGSTFWFRIKS